MFSKHDYSISRRSFLRGILAASSSFTAGSRFAWAAGAPERLVVAMSVGVDSINPYGHSDSPLYGLWGHVMEALVDTDYERKSFSPELAESWSPKGNQWTFKLRKNVNFHDGAPFTGKDVAYSYERIMKDKGSVLQAPNLSDIKDIKVPDDQTVVINYRPTEGCAPGPALQPGRVKSQGSGATR